MDLNFQLNMEKNINKYNIVINFRAKVGGKDAQSHIGNLHCPSSVNTFISKCVYIPLQSVGLPAPIPFSEAVGNRENIP